MRCIAGGRQPGLFGFLSLILLILILLGSTGIRLSARTNFYRSRGLVEVDVSLDGRIKGRFGIDTGADRLYIDRAFAQENGFSFAENTRKRRAAGISGSSEIAFVDLRSLDVDGQELGARRATAVDLRKMIGNRPGPIPDGLIGYSILRSFYVTVDYPAATISLDTEPPRDLRSRDYTEYRFYQSGHLILVDVMMPNGSTNPMVLDYCATHTTLSPELARTAGLAATPGILQNVSSMTLTDAEVGQNVVVTNVPVVVEDLSEYGRSMPHARFAGILGGTFLNRLKLTVDYSQERLYIYR